MGPALRRHIRGTGRAAALSQTLHRERLAQDSAREFACIHRLREEEALHNIEAELADGHEVGAGLDTFGHGAQAEAIGEGWAGSWRRSWRKLESARQFDLHAFRASDFIVQ